jgi:Family of unknown function (DUF5681)
MDDGEDDYEVGYRKPPKHTQFQPGRSGNPQGRPRKSKQLDRMIQDELDKTIVVKQDGRERRITIREAIVTQLVRQAIKGEMKPLQIVLDHLEKHREIEPFVPTEADDAALIQELARNAEGVDDGNS